MRQVHYITATAPLHYTTLHYNYSYNCNYNYTTLHPAIVVRWPLQPLQPLQKHNSNHLSVHQWIRSAIRDSQQPISPIGFLFLKLPPPPCAVLLVLSIIYTLRIYIYIHRYESKRIPADPIAYPLPLKDALWKESEIIWGVAGTWGMLQRHVQNHRSPPSPDCWDVESNLVGSTLLGYWMN